MTQTEIIHKINIACSTDRIDPRCMRQVADKARQIGFVSLAELVESDIRQGKTGNGQYMQAVAEMLGPS